MPISLTEAELNAVLAEHQKLTASIAKRDESIAGQADVVQAATDADNAEKKVFDFYDVSIIGTYEDEREQLDGTYVEDPVTKAELDLVGQLDSTQRLFPTNPVTEPIRIDQFDGTPLITTDNEISGVPSDLASSTQLDTEPYWLARQAEREDWLANGFGGTSPTITATTFIVEAVTPATTQITVQTTVDTENAVFAVGDTFVAKDGSNQVGIKVVDIVSQINGDPDAGFCTGEDNPVQTTQATCEADNGTWTSEPTTYEAVLTILVLTPGSITASGTIDETWAGFSNSDRTAKVDSTDGYTSMLTDLIDDLDTMITNRITRLEAQETALGLNEDPSLDATALTNVQTSITALESWQVSMNVADSDLATLASERATRSPQITARITAIGTALSGFFDARYTSAINIGDTSRGTARIKYFRAGAQSVTADMKATEEARLSAIEDLLILAGEDIPVYE